MKVARVRAQAKINLYLRVLAREASGYHSIETIFQRLDFGDDVTVRIANGRSLDCHGDAMPAAGLGPVEKNLAFRAAVAYADATGFPKGFAIDIDKHIPVGGGLGGGSADAGAVLRALDTLSPNPLGPRLAELGAALGADVPFMAIASPMALAWGRGERMLPLRPLEPRAVVLLVPDFPIGTAEAYDWVAADRGSYQPEGHLLAADSLATWAGVAALAANEFEPVVARRHPQIAYLVESLAALGAAPAMMTGSGSTVFGVFAPESNLAALGGNLGATPIVTRTSDRVVRVALEE